MTETLAKTVDITVERTISASPSEVFDAWLDPTVPGTLWHGHDKLIFDPKVDALWYLQTFAHRPDGTPHFGRFIEIDRPRRLRHSWMSRNTLGEETVVTVTFEKQGNHTLLAIRHSGLPDGSSAKKHEKGWNFILDRFGARITDGITSAKVN
jgi:uncharacterized protein YndB with AHSA1/START domain